MRFEKYDPSERLRPYIKYFVVSENKLESEYKVFPSSGMVLGFQYRGQLARIKNDTESNLSAAGITGISDGFKIFKNSGNIGTILVYFTEVGFTHFASHPAHELFDLCISLDEIFDKNRVNQVEENLALVSTDKQRIKIVEQFLIAELKHFQTDRLIVEAIKIIYQTKGTIRVKDLNQMLFISQSPFEKRFRKVVGTTPKKFASIIRFQSVLNNMDATKSLAEICYENNFFDQAHFIKAFKSFTGQTPDRFRRLK